MTGKHACWTRSRAGRNRVHWVAYDDRPGSEGCQIVDQGYAASLPEADAAARAALAAQGMYQARRASTAFRPAKAADRESAEPTPRTARPKPQRPREYLYTRRPGDHDEVWLAAHLIVKKTAKRVYVSRRSCGPDQLGTTDESWSDDEPAIALDRLKLERDGSVYSSGHRTSDFFVNREQALGDSATDSGDAFRRLGLRAPSSLEEIKAAYRRKALDVHPDRGGTPADFQAVEAAYRRLIREADAPEA